MYPVVLLSFDADEVARGLNGGIIGGQAEPPGYGIGIFRNMDQLTGE